MEETTLLTAIFPTFDTLAKARSLPTIHQRIRNAILTPNRCGL